MADGLVQGPEPPGGDGQGAVPAGLGCGLGWKRRGGGGRAEVGGGTGEVVNGAWWSLGARTGHRRRQRAQGGVRGPAT